LSGWIRDGISAVALLTSICHNSNTEKVAIIVLITSEAIGKRTSEECDIGMVLVEPFHMAEVPEVVQAALMTGC
jgi:hypothetical protein